MLRGSRISQHIRDYNHHNHNHNHNHHHLVLGLGFGFGFGFCYSRRRMLRLSSSFIAVSDKRSNYSSSSSTVVCPGGCLHPKSPCSTTTKIPVLSDCFSQHGDDPESPPEGFTSVAGGIVALGKFDALHVGHRELAIQSAKIGVPFLLSFVGMAEVLGWEPRAPIVAKCDRKRVLSSWAPYCGHMIPAEYQVEFSKVRQLTPRQFVEKLSKEFRVRGVVAGENYRFGYRAAGNASELVRLCEEYGMEAYIINSVMDQNSRNMVGSSDSKEQGQVSSTRVRCALAKGDIKYVSELLGRQHRLVLMVKDRELLISNQHRVSAEKSCLLNLPPKDGLYESCSLFIGSEIVVPCRVTIDATHIHLEFDEVDTCIRIISQDSRCLGIEFGFLECWALAWIESDLVTSEDKYRRMLC